MLLTWFSRSHDGDGRHSRTFKRLESSHSDRWNAQFYCSKHNFLHMLISIVLSVIFIAVSSEEVFVEPIYLVDRRQRFVVPIHTKFQSCRGESSKNGPLATTKQANGCQSCE